MHFYEKTLKINYLFSLIFCLVQFASWSQSNTFCTKAQKLIGTFSVYHFRPIALNGTTAAEVVDLFIDEIDKRGYVLKQSDIALLKENSSQLFDQIKSNDDSYIKNAKKIYRHALLAVDSSLAVIATKKLNFTQNDTIYLMPFNQKTIYSPGINYHSKRLEKNIKKRCYDRVTNTEYEKLTETEFNSRAIEYSKTIISNLQNYIKQLIAEADQEVEANLLNAIALRHDPHSNYFTHEQKREFTKQLSSKIESFGFFLNEDEDGNIAISYIEPGGSAWTSNEVNEGDLFVSVKIGINNYSNDENTAEDIQDKLDKTTENKIVLKLKKQNGQVKIIKLIKQKTVSVDNTVKGYVLKSKSGNIGYISLPSFYGDMQQGSAPGCANDVAKELLKLETDSIKGLILDLRNNGGGSILEAMNLAGIFVDEGPLFIYKERVKKPYLIKDINRGSIFRKPLVVMINETSASASELFGNIVKDYNLGLVIGQTSYGKGTAQNVLPLDTNALHIKNGMQTATDFIKITNGKFYRLNCSTHQGTGVIPDIVLPAIPGYSMYKENKEAFFIEPDVITKNVVYTPNTVINKAAIQQKSVTRIKESADFKRYKQSSDSMLVYLNSPQKFVLKYTEYKKYKKQMDDLYASFEHASQATGDDIKCINNTFDLKIVEMNEQTKEFNNRVRDFIQKDIYIHEAFYIINDYN